MAKLNKCYSLNVDEETAQKIEAIAEHEQRKPRELLRLLLVPAIKKEYTQMLKDQIEEIKEENQAAPSVAKFQA